ncbi:hypothetical protein [Zobellia alginiliquefaciens]|uniref:hypothetical protein n=1 Tax=Zobellia alginiliquefaciens TaxID=3032586 RepID=UPI0023E26B85|nr:hypothetical protein [Zobellia alginiliquefaciens]
MKNMSKVLFILIFSISCADEPNFLQLGIESFKVENYSLAKNQLKMVNQSDKDGLLAKRYLSKIDSIEASNRIVVQKTDSINSIKIKEQIKNHLGNYKVSVIGASMDKSVEVFQLKEGGESVWLWVDYVDGNPMIDDKKYGTWWLDSKGNITIRVKGNTGVIEEVFSNIDGRLIELNRKKRSLLKTSELF